MTTPLLGLTELASNQNNKYITHNQALKQIERLCGAPIIDIESDPPASPSLGDFYAIEPTATGVWAGLEGNLTVWNGSGWEFTPAVIGTVVWGKLINNFVVWDGTNWILPPGFGGSNTDELVGVSDNDTTPGYLLDKFVAGTNITLTENNDGGNETITIDAAGGGGGNDELAAVSANDTTPDYLFNKIAVSGEAKKSISNPSGDEFLVISSGVGITAENTSGNPTASDTFLIPIDVSSAGRTVTPPAVPNFRTIFGVVDSRANCSVNNIVIDFTGAGDNYYGTSQNYTMQVDGEMAIFRYVSATVGWVKESIASAGGGGATKYTENLGDGIATTFTVNHALGSSDVLVSVRENTLPGAEVYPTITIVDANNIEVDFGATVPSTDEFRVVVL